MCNAIPEMKSWTKHDRFFFKYNKTMIVFNNSQNGDLENRQRTRSCWKCIGDVVVYNPVSWNWIYDGLRITLALKNEKLIIKICSNLEF